MNNPNATIDKVRLPTTGSTIPYDARSLQELSHGEVGMFAPGLRGVAIYSVIIAGSVHGTRMGSMCNDRNHVYPSDMYIMYQRNKTLVKI